MTHARALLAVAALAGCAPSPRPHAAPALAAVTYVVGAPYRAGGVWRYPHESFDADETGVATVTTRTSGTTADGERADPSAMAAAHPDLQLPAVARVTNLDTGLQVLVRVNDRGPEARGRLIALTPGVMRALGLAGQVALRVRVQVLEDSSRQLAAELNADAALHLEVASAPTVAIAAETLPLPPGATQAANLRRAAAPAPMRPVIAVRVEPVPLRLPETLTRVPPRPGGLYIEAASFGGLRYAEMLRLRLSSLGARTITSYAAPRDQAYRVRIGPLESVAAADAALDETMRAGIGDARIVAE